MGDSVVGADSEYFRGALVALLIAMIEWKVHGIMVQLESCVVCATVHGED